MLQQKKRVLIVEDEQSIRHMLCYKLRAEQFDVDEAPNIIQAKRCIACQCPAIILLDWMLPQGSGIELIKQLRSKKKTGDIPIILLTARASEENKVLGLESGADDYIVKPFSLKELIARMHSVMRRGIIEHVNGTIVINELTIDLNTQRVLYRDQEVKFGPLEYRLLYFFATHQDRVYSRDDLLSHVWGNDVYLDERTVDVHIQRLRKRLSTCGYDSLIRTARGSGYCFSKQYAH